MKNKVYLQLSQNDIYIFDIKRVKGVADTVADRLQITYLQHTSSASPNGPTDIHS